MNLMNIAKGIMGLIAIGLVVYGLGFRSRYLLTREAKEDVQMGRYHLALKKLEMVRASRLPKTSREAALQEYNLGVVNTFLGENKTAHEHFKRASQTHDPVLKARALYNEANLLAQELDFANAAQGYAKVLEIDPNDFQAKKNLERMRLGQQQFSTLFSPEKEEREERVQALKLMPWGNRYKYSGEQKLRW
jgi:tetratricopeptide (TPR) repeat protein